MNENENEPIRTWACKNGACHGTVELWFAGADTECGWCGTEYNAFGQRLRSDWRGNPSNYDEDISDLEGFEMQHSWSDW